MGKALPGHVASKGSDASGFCPITGKWSSRRLQSFYDSKVDEAGVNAKSKRAMLALAGQPNDPSDAFKVWVAGVGVSNRMALAATMARLGVESTTHVNDFTY
jgi:hypothetical protein